MLNKKYFYPGASLNPQYRGKIFEIEPKESPRWFEIRKRLAIIFVKIARWFYPRSDAVNSFFLEKLLDAVIEGKVATQIKWEAL